MTALLKYDAARAALAECRAIDEVKSWADRAAAMQAYAKIAQDRGMETDAAEIRIRAERRLGEMIAAQKAAGGLNAGGRPAEKKPLVGDEGLKPLVGDEGLSQAPRLADAGISYDLSSRAQKLAAVPENQFEQEISGWRDRIEQEGARVSAKLELTGARVLAEQEPVTDPSTDAAIDADELESMRRIIAADDSLAAAVAECQQLRLQARSLQARIDGMLIESAEQKRVIKGLRNKLRAIEGEAA